MDGGVHLITHIARAMGVLDFSNPDFNLSVWLSMKILPGLTDGGIETRGIACSGEACLLAGH
jgi:hypothetical protein